MIRVASYNIRKAVGLDWRRDPDRIVDVLAEIDADIVALQEADRRIGARAGVLPLDRLSQDLSYEVADISVRPDSHGWHGNVILYRRDLRLTETSRINIPVIEPRGAVSARFSVPHLEVIGAHLGLTPGRREKQMKTLAEYARAQPHPVIVAGDLNEWKADITAFGAHATVISPGASFHAANPRAPLDRFVLFGGVSCTSAWVHQTRLATEASDHLPVVMDVELSVPEGPEG